MPAEGDAPGYTLRLAIRLHAQHDFGSLGVVSRIRPQVPDCNGSARSVLCQNAAQFADVANRVVVDAHNDVTGLQASTLGAGAHGDRLDEQSLAHRQIRTVAQ